MDIRQLYGYHYVCITSNFVRFKTPVIRVILSFHRQVHEDYACLGFYAASSGNTLPTFRNKLSGSISNNQESSWPF
jgi:hypothetical protein